MAPGIRARERSIPRSRNSRTRAWSRPGRRAVVAWSPLRPRDVHYLEERSARLGDPFADFADAPNRPDLRDPLHQLHAAVRQIEVGGDATQLEAAAQVLAQARRSLYLILAGEAEDVGE